MKKILVIICIIFTGCHPPDRRPREMMVLPKKTLILNLEKSPSPIEIQSDGLYFSQDFINQWFMRVLTEIKELRMRISKLEIKSQK